MNLSHVLALHARHNPGKIAVLEGARSLSYGQFEQSLQRLAAGLSALGVGRGDVVGVGLGDCSEHLVALYALARLGAVTLPLEVRWTPSETARVLTRFGAVAALLENAAWEALQGDTEFHKEASLPPGLEKRIVTRTGGAPGAAHDLESLLGGGAGTSAAPPEDVDWSDHPLAIALTSGTTGQPKGALVTHGRMLARMMAQWAHLSFHVDDRYLSATPLFHGAGRSFCMSHLYLGATVVLGPEKFDPRAVLEAIAAHRITTVFLVPTQLQRIVELEDVESFDRSSLRVVLSSGSALSPALRTRVLERFSPRLFDYYGSMDGGGISVLRPEDMRTHADSVGRPMLHVDVRIEDPAGQELPPGAEGEVCYRGPGILSGYVNNPEATAAALKDGWLHSGDLGRMDGEGYLSITGRISDIIIRGGVNIYPAEVEAALLEHPAVREAAVVGVPDEEYGETVAAFVVLREPFAPEALEALCAKRLAAYKVPRRFVTVEEIPRNVGGKAVKEHLLRLLKPVSENSKSALRDEP